MTGNPNNLDREEQAGRSLNKRPAGFVFPVDPFLYYQEVP